MVPGDSPEIPWALKAGMARSQKKLTQQTLESLRTNSNGKDVIYFDMEIPRFRVRVKPSAVKSYILQ